MHRNERKKNPNISVEKLRLNDPNFMAQMAQSTDAMVQSLALRGSSLDKSASSEAEDAKTVLSSQNQIRTKISTRSKDKKSIPPLSPDDPNQTANRFLSQRQRRYDTSKEKDKQPERK